MENNGIILLVDNDLYLNNTNQNNFYWRDYTVLTATSYNEARMMLRKTEPDIIIMEAILPDGDGFDFCREIVSETLASIVFLTIKTDSSDMVRGFTLGADEYLKKPIHREVLAARIEVVMRRRKRTEVFQ